MKINIDKVQFPEIVIGDVETIKTGINVKDINKILYMLSQGNYKQPIHSTIRETVSNALDAQVEAGIDCLEKPVVVYLDDTVFKVRDWGVGIDDERMNIIKDFGSSTKENDTNSLGFFGIGFYAPLSLEKSFTVESIKEGIKRMWVVQKSGINVQILKVDEQPSDEPTGTTITTTVDRFHDFYAALIKTSVYFKGVVFQSPYEGITNLNSIKIIEGKNFIISTDFQLNNFHIVLGQVVYPINPSDVGIVERDIIEKIGIKFGTNEGLIPTPSRENIILDEPTKEKIFTRYKEAIEEVFSYYNKEEKDLLSILKTSKTSDIKINIKGKDIFLRRGEIQGTCRALAIDNLLNNLYDLPKVFKSVPMQGIANYFNICFRKTAEICHNKYYRYNDSYWTMDHGTTILLDRDLKNTDLAFLKSLSYKIHLIKHKPIKELDTLLQRNVLSKEHKILWREILTAIRKEEEKSLNALKKISDYDQEIKDFNKSRGSSSTGKKVVNRSNGQIVCKTAYVLSDSKSKYNFIVQPVNYRQDEVVKKLMIYSENREDIDKLVDIWTINNNIVPTLVTKKDKQIIEENNLRNFISYEDFKSGKTRFTKKWVTARIILDDMKESNIMNAFFSFEGWRQTLVLPVNRFARHRVNTNIKSGVFSQYMVNSVQEVVEYVKDYQSKKIDDRLYNEMKMVYIKHGLVDTAMLNQYYSIKTKILPYAKYLVECHNSSFVVQELFEKFYTYRELRKKKK